MGQRSIFPASIIQNRRTVPDIVSAACDCILPALLRATYVKSGWSELIR
ncbi:hypothetical protein ACSAZL_17020 [Methanosarcina sp. T3]